MLDPVLIVGSKRDKNERLREMNPLFSPVIPPRLQKLSMGVSSPLFPAGLFLIPSSAPEPGGFFSVEL